MSNSLDSFLTRIGDVTIERVTPRSSSKPNEAVISNENSTNTNMSNAERQTGNDESSEESSGETSDGEQEKKNDTLQSEEIEEIRSEGSGDDMDLDETIDSQIGVRMESEQLHHSQPEEDDDEPVNILDTLPLEGAPIEGQEVSEADLLGKPLSKDTDDEDSIEHDDHEKHETNSMEDDNSENNKRHAELELSDTAKKKQRKDDGSEGTASECETKAEKKLANMRRNIREVMDETQLDEATLSAQRQEMERLRRVQEQQRIIREVQRQIAINRQNNKTQTRVISLLQGKQNQAVPTRPTGPNMLQQRIRMMTPSVSISPVVPKKEPMDRSEYYSDSELSDIEAEEALREKQMHATRKLCIGPKPQKGAKGKDVVTISSSSESSDDDCIVLSDPSGEEETDNEDDPSNSGMHTNDRYNIPDEHGRVLINVGHPETEPDVFLAPQVARIIKPHQIGGIRFLYDNIVESIERYKTSSGFGCILAHSMGLGKTLQVASFCDIFFRCTTAKTVLCIMPINTLQNWLAEFNMWLPYKDHNATEKDAPIGMELRPRHFRLHILNDSHKTMTARAKVIQEWQVGGGVLLIGYELYRQLSLKKPNKAKRKRGQPFKDTVDVEEEDKNKGLLNEMHAALVNPGPDLVICDEGHRIKNSHASISMALKQMRTKRRIVLTGYPLQNNLLEYWCMVDFVRPNYLGTKSEFCNMFERPIQNGQCIDSTPQDIRLMRYRAHVLHALLEGFVQRRSHSVLQVSLPRKEEYILLVRMTTHQRKLYDTFMNQVVKTRAVPNPLKAFAVCCKIWNHPDILYHFLRKRQANEEDDLDLEETIGEKPAAAGGKRGNNYEVPGMFSRQAYPYQDHGRNYTSNLNQGSSNYSQVPNQSSFQSQMPNQSANMSMPDYSPYTPNQGQNYSSAPGQTSSMYSRSENQPLQTSTLGYSANQQNSNATPQTSTTGYLPNQQGQGAAAGQNRGFSPNQQNQNLTLQNSSHTYTGPQSQNMPLPNQPHNYPPQVNTNSSSQSSLPFNQQTTNPMSQNQSNPYMTNSSNQASISQNQMRGYPATAPNQINVPPNSSSYPTGQSTSNTPTQTHGYPQDQQGTVSNSQSTLHGYSHLVSSSASQSQSSYPPNAQNQPGAPPGPNHAYSSNHQGSASMPQTPTHRYGPSQQGQVSQSQNQSLTYPQNQQTPAPSLNQSDQLYSRPDGQQQGQNYAPTSNTAHEFSTDRQGGNSSANPTNNYPVNQTQPQNPVLSSYSSDGTHQNQVGQMKGPEDPYWQRNYSQPFRSDQCNDPYYRDVNPNVNRYQNNYFPSQNYQNQFNDYSNNHSSDANSRTDDSKPQQPVSNIPNSGSCDKNGKEMTSSVGVQSQPIHQSNVSTSSNYSSESGCQTPVSRSVQSLGSSHSPRLNQTDLVKEEDREKEDLLDKDKEDKSDDEILTKDEEKDCKSSPGGKEDPGIPYDWATELMKGYVPGLIDASAKMTIFFCILEEAIKLGDRVLAFSQYGQQKPCFVYRLVTDNCLERKIYDRQISKQGMADRVVDQCNPDAHLSLKEATTLSWDWEEDSQVQDFSQTKDSYTDEVMHRVLERYSSLLTKQPFHHESLLVDRKDKKLSQAEKRLARRGYELEKMAANCSRPSYNYVPGNTATRAGGLQIRAIRGGDSGTTSKPVASVRPMQQRGAEGLGTRGVTGSRWIPAEVWQRQGMSAQEMTLPLDVVIPTNSPDKGSIVLKAGQRVMVLKSPKGIYMQLESGKIIAIRTALKLNQQKREEEPKKGVSAIVQRNSKPEVGFPLRNNSAISIIPKSSSSNQTSGRPINKPGTGPNYRPFADKEISKRPKPVATATAKPYTSQVNLTNQVSLSRLPRVKQEPVDHSTLGENSNSSDGQVRTEQRVEEVRLEDVVAEVSSNTDYSPSNHNRVSNSDTDTSLQKSSEENSQVYASDTVTTQGVQTQHEQTETELTSKHNKQCSPSIEKQVMKTNDALTNYGHGFQNQQENRDAPNDEIIIEDPPQVSSQIQTQLPSQMPSQMPPQGPPHVPPQVMPQVTSQVPSQLPPQMSPQVPPQMSPQAQPQIPTPIPPQVPAHVQPQIPPQVQSQVSPQVTPQMPSQMPPQMSSQVGTQATSSAPLTPLLTQQSTPSTMQVPPIPTLRGTEVTKGITDSTVGSTATSVCTGTNTMTSPKMTESSIRETSMQGEPNIPQGYPYAQYPRYYDYSDPRSRSLATPYGTYFPGVPPHTSNPRLPVDTTKTQPDLGKPMEDRTMMNVPPTYSQVPNTTAKTLANTTETKGAPGYPTYGGPTYNTDYARMYSAFHGPPPPADPYIHRGYAPPSSHPPNYYPPFPHPPPPYPNYSFLSPYPNPNMPSEPQPPAQ
ncbi:Helicase ARIP4 [Dufourea novaeangliae]|uniref:Helicase ARIP4 n=1 Tax=Dufourea novaeangliae TaxID=178035 RepID=A0A154PEK0_DUFNO|nr:Helicase ARIP4 [Dufourea novaeangliae]